MKKIIVIINTYERPELLLRLLNNIYDQKKGFDIHLRIYNDKSISNYKNVISFLRDKFPDKAHYYLTDVHHGKQYYWKITNFSYNKIKNEQFDYVIQLPDDVQLVPNFFKTTIKQFDSINDDDKACLNILNDRSRYGASFWTPVKAEKIKFGKNIFWHTGWVDMCFISSKNYFKTLDYEIYPVDIAWSSSQKLSSGVGMQISQRLYQEKQNIYQVNDSLVIHGNHPSVMHFKHRQKTPLISNHNSMNKIIASCASIPSRERSLKDTVNSIINQVDRLYVYLNDYKKVPNFLKHNKITVFRSQNESGDLGDAGKFYPCEKVKGYFFTIDDDIIYPPDYVTTFISAIEKHKRKCVVSVHGRNFNNLPTHSYYHGFSEAFSCLQSVINNHFIHICGTGVLAYHTDTIKVKPENFEASNMADIWFSKLCQEQNIPVLCLKHNRGWITTSKNYDESLTIYSSCNNKDEFQTKIINSIKWKINLIK